MPALPLRRLAAAASLLLAASACATAAPRAPGQAGGAALVREAEVFMDAYARDLRAGDREAIAARYDRRGAYRMGFGQKVLEPFDSIRAQYLTRWSPPRSFQWRDLSYEPVGPEAVLVLGRFDWEMEGGRVLDFSYTGLLVRQDGTWRIRVEDESADPRTLPLPPTAADSARG
jgi:Domain of unknown function (DUF4440)